MRLCFRTLGSRLQRFDFGPALESLPICWDTTAMMLMVAIVYVGILFCHIRALWLQRSMSSCASLLWYGMKLIIEIGGLGLIRTLLVLLRLSLFTKLA